MSLILPEIIIKKITNRQKKWVNLYLQRPYFRSKWYIVILTIIILDFTIIHHQFY